MLRLVTVAALSQLSFGRSAIDSYHINSMSVRAT